MEKKRSMVSSMLSNKCPRCREGDLYVQKGIFPLRKMLDMHERCEVCGQKTEIEIGFYYGTGYVSYGLSLALAVFNIIWYYLFFGFSWVDNSIWEYLGITIAMLFILQPFIMRLSRSLYISFFVKYDPLAKENVYGKSTEEVEKETLDVKKETA